jgi:hypothetical protein
MEASGKASLGLRVSSFELIALQAEPEMEICNPRFETLLLPPTLPESPPSSNFGGINIS